MTEKPLLLIQETFSTSQFSQSRWQNCEDFLPISSSIAIRCRLFRTTSQPLALNTISIRIHTFTSFKAGPVVNRVYKYCKQLNFKSLFLDTTHNNIITKHHPNITSFFTHFSRGRKHITSLKRNIRSITYTPPLIAYNVDNQW